MSKPEKILGETAANEIKQDEFPLPPKFQTISKLGDPTTFHGSLVESENNHGVLNIRLPVG